MTKLLWFVPCANTVSRLKRNGNNLAQNYGENISRRTDGPPAQIRDTMNDGATIVLHADDDPNDLLLVKHACRAAGLPCSIESVSDGEVAIAYLSGQTTYADRASYPLPALILLDLKMPRRTGFEVLEWIRSQPNLRRVPVIILTSSRHEGDINWTYDHGANSYLVKPVGFEALVEMLKTIHHYWLNMNERPSV